MKDIMKPFGFPRDCTWRSECLNGSVPVPVVPINEKSLSPACDPTDAVILERDVHSL